MLKLEASPGAVCKTARLPARLRPRPLGWLLVCAALGGCAMGPDFKAPAPPAAAQGANYTEGPLPDRTVASAGADGAAQRFVADQDIPAQWWTLYHSEALNQLIDQALKNSPTLAAAQATLRQAQESYRAASGQLEMPSVTGQLGISRQHASAVSSGAPGGVEYTLYNAAVNVSYTVDLFGANRRALEGQQALVDTQQYQLEAARLALSANVVTAAIREAALRAQLQATNELLAAQEQQLALLQRQFQLGAVGQLPVVAQQSAVAATRAGVPALEKSLAQTRHLLAVLAGRLPSETGLGTFTLDALSLPQDLPVSLASNLVRQRPDIRASEAQLHAAAAQVGVATANLYPQINLSASLGSAALKESNLFGSGWGFWSLLAGVTQPIFNGGALSAKQHAAQAALDAAAAQYRGTVLQAFQNVADSLRAIEFDAQVLQAQTDAAALAHQTLTLTTQQYQLGAVGYLALLDAQRGEQQARINLVSARAARYADTAALFQSLGGGWWHAPALASKNS